MGFRMRSIIIVSLLILGFNCSDNSKIKNERIDPLVKAAGYSEKFEFLYSDTEIFFNRFMSDSIFQLSHVSFPLEGTYETYDESRKWRYDNWNYMSWDINQVVYNTDDSVSVIQEPSEFFLGTYCKECGFSFELKLNIGFPS